MPTSVPAYWPEPEKFLIHSKRSKERHWRPFSMENMYFSDVWLTFDWQMVLPIKSLIKTQLQSIKRMKNLFYYCCILSSAALRSSRWWIKRSSQQSSTVPEARGAGHAPLSSVPYLPVCSHALHDSWPCLLIGSLPLVSRTTTPCFSSSARPSSSRPPSCWTSCRSMTGTSSP